MKHIHAELMKQYAEDAMVTSDPWRLWEVKVLSEWTQPLCSPAWLVDAQYRRKPKTININGFEVPEPYRGFLEKNIRFYTPSLHYKNGTETRLWTGNKECQRMRGNGIIHLDLQPAALHSQALASFTELRA